MGIESINEPFGRTWMVLPQSHNEPTLRTVTSIDPVSAVMGDPDLLLHVYGTGFFDGLQIVFNGGLETTVFVSETELTTIVKPSLAGVPGSYPVTVGVPGYTNPVAYLFTFTAAGEDPDELEDEIDQSIEDGDIKPLHPPRKKRR